MAQSYLELLGHVVTAVHAVKESGDLGAALQKGGFAKERVAEGEKLAHEAEELLRKKIDVIGEDRTREHAFHAASQEVEMWMQTVAFKVKKAVCRLPSMFQSQLTPSKFGAATHWRSIRQRDNVLAAASRPVPDWPSTWNGIWCSGVRGKILPSPIRVILIPNSRRRDSLTAAIPCTPLTSIPASSSGRISFIMVMYLT